MNRMIRTLYWIGVGATAAGIAAKIAQEGIPDVPEMTGDPDVDRRLITMAAVALIPFAWPVLAPLGEIHAAYKVGKSKKDAE